MANDTKHKFLSELRPRDRVLVWYSGDKVWHERLLVRPVSSSLWFIATPDRDAYLERIVGGARTDSPIKCVPLDAEGNPKTAVQGELYRFSSPVREADWDRLRQSSEDVCSSRDATAMLRRGEKRWMRLISLLVRTCRCPWSPLVLAGLRSLFRTHTSGSRPPTT